MKRLFFLAVLLAGAGAANAQAYNAIKSQVQFFSHTDVKDIDAKSNSLNVDIDFTEFTFEFKIPMKSFDFTNDLMEEHFNENYMESDKYPVSIYKGKFTSAGKIDLSKDGSYPVTTEGALDMHGVKKNRTIPATVLVKDGKLYIAATFKVKLIEHNIDRPTVVFAEIADEITVTVSAKLQKK